jgi:hypothetical protein
MEHPTFYRTKHRTTMLCPNRNFGRWLREESLLTFHLCCL